MLDRMQTFVPNKLPAFLAFSLSAASTAGSAEEYERVRFTARDMLGIVAVREESVTLSPGATWAAFVYPDVTNEMNILSRRPKGSVRAINLVQDETVQVSRGGNYGAFPAWSPDGQHLAYFAESSGDFSLQIWNSATGETRSITGSFKGEPWLPPQWSSDGRYLVFARPVAPVQDASTTVFPPPPTFARAVQQLPEGELPRVVVIDSADERIPGDAPFIDARRAVLSVVEVSSGDESELTEPVHLRDFDVSPDGPYALYSFPTDSTFGVIGEVTRQTNIVSLDEMDAPSTLTREGEKLQWRPDGQSLYYIASGDIHSISLDGDRGDTILGESIEAPIRKASLSPDGGRVAMLVPDQEYSDPEVVVPVDSNAEMYSIAKPLMNLYIAERSSDESTLVDLGTANLLDVTNFVWSPDSASLIFTALDRKSYDEYLYIYDVERRQLDRLTDGEEAIGTLDSEADRILFTAEQATQPADLFLLDMVTGERSRVTELNPQLSRFSFSTPTLFHYYNGDGERLGALLYRPVNIGAQKNVPVITYVYEKLTSRRHRFNARAQIFLNHGFAFLMPNVKIKITEPGTSFVKSVVPATAAVRAMGFTNGKFAIWGGSFGAYATSYIITQTDAFACAAARSVPPDLFVNWASGRDRDSRNIERGQARMGGSPYEVMRRYFVQSAFFHLKDVDTPILIMHGAQDETILFHEGEMFFYALRQLGKEAKFVAYTYGDHSLYRHSRADALDVHERLLDWFSGCLK